MACYHPLTAYKSSEGIVFKKPNRPAAELKLACGQCIGCRIAKSKEWAIRCVHEASLYKNNCFITLTYRNEDLPSDGSLNKTHFQKFMKRFRKQFPHQKIRYFHCGEYGEKNLRPHYHACIFNFDFNDRKLFKVTNKVNIYTSEQLTKLWPFGFSTVGDVTYQSAAYVARYIFKKINGERAKEHYQNVDTDTGEVHQLTPEYITMSRRPGIARDWFEKFASDVFPDDFVIFKGKKQKTPSFYTAIYQNSHPDDCEKILLKRQKEAKKQYRKNKDRLETKEKCTQLKLNQLKRELH